MATPLEYQRMDNDDFIYNQILDNEHIYHPAILSAYEKADERVEIYDWVEKKGVSEINTIICEYTDLRQVLKLMKQSLAIKIQAKEKPSNEDRNAYSNYLEKCCYVFNDELKCSYESYENWRTDVK